MALVGTRELFEKAYREKYAVGAFNINNMEILQGIIDGARQQNAPLILQVSSGARKYASPIYLKRLAEAAVESAPDLPIALHLDHGDSFELCKDCIDWGFTSVMIDASALPFGENVALTKKVVEYAHPRSVPVEAELGRLSGIEDHMKVKEREATFTDPDEAVAFVEKSGCDSLAVAVGTSHGAYKFKGEPWLDFHRLEALTKKLEGFPLVLHGASSVIPEFVEECNRFGGKLPGARGVPEEMITRASKLGVCKVNIDTDLRLAMTASIRKHFYEHPEDFDPRKYLGPAREAIKKMVVHKIGILGCTGKAGG